MKKALGVFGLILLTAVLAYAADTQPASQPALQAIRYQRTGGFAGTNDVIEITPDAVTE